MGAMSPIKLAFSRGVNLTSPLKVPHLDRNDHLEL
jgi:hypothetical protein